MPADETRLIQRSEQHETVPSGLSGAQKAAILLLSLAEPEATQLMLRMPEADVARVSREMSRLGDIPARVRMDVLAEFCDMAEAGAPDPLTTPPTPPAAGRFDLLCGLGLQELVALLEHEPARTTALVLAHLPPPQAGPILTALAPQKQVQIVRQIAAIRAISQQEISAVETQLNRRLGDRLAPAARTAGSVSR